MIVTHDFRFLLQEDWLNASTPALSTQWVTFTRFIPFSIVGLPTKKNKAERFTMNLCFLACPRSFVRSVDNELFQASPGLGL